MRILCVIENMGSGGAQRQLMELAIGLRELGHRISFLTYRPESFFSEILEKEGIKINVINTNSYIKRFIKMRKYIRSGNYNTIISFLEGSNFICEMAGIPFHKWILIVGERSANPKILKSLKLIVYRWFHLNADYIVSNSHSNINLIKQVNPFLSLSKCKTIYNIVDFNQWSPDKDYVPRKNGKLKLVIAASHQKLKNSNGLVEALALLTSKEKNMIQVDWYGDRLEAPFFDESLYEVKKKISNYKLNDIITFYPATIELNLKIKEADVVGLFSFYEGFPNIICEGMACGKLVICSKVSDIPYILSYNNNLIFDPNNIESIQNTISYVIGLEDQQLISIGKLNERLARELFNKETILKKYIELIGA